ncbi:carboxylic acid reductase [Williamsia sp. CHRR-6]|uniref:carboxylic acid reductase n=1 Tax=Williamsia sp. CHRR-6 TaxID=2835871 RepID=UPI001BDA0EF2|nr:carboxylic acid reductase [Williamsia sp. CHRR-6]MBT0568158.1 thioester reductase domain-containing protein [Williamsia sp. CHRR-6]
MTETISTPTASPVQHRPSSREQRSQRSRRRLAELMATDPQVRDSTPLPEVTRRFGDNRPLSEIIIALMTDYADRPALGRRSTRPVADSATGRTTRRLQPDFETITYRELADRATALCAHWFDSGLRVGDMVATLGFSSVDYAVVEVASTLLGVVGVPLQTSASAARLAPILDEVAPRSIAVSVDHLADMVALIASGPRPISVIVFDHDGADDDHRQTITEAHEVLDALGVDLITLADAIAHGAECPAAPLHQATARSSELAGLLYTSGSTGTPKGAIYTVGHAARLWAGNFMSTSAVPEITINYLPLSHLAGRAALMHTLSRGGTAYFVARADLSTLFDDIAAVRPTDLMLVPRVCDMIFQRFRGELDRAQTSGAADNIHDPDHLARTVKESLRTSVFGGRVVSALCGTAPLTDDIAEFMADCLDTPIADGYGSTEAGAVTINGRLAAAVTEAKLVDVPELGYHTTDSPHPRGELLVKSEAVIPGYYKRPDLNAEVFDADGFYRTGDVMAQVGDDQFVYLDRRKNVIKLSQGEFVAVAQLEATYSAAPGVHQIFVYGNSSRAYLLAVVVPTTKAVAAAGGDNARLRAQLSAAIADTARSAGLNSYEIPREILVERQPFTAEAGLLSGVGKLLRPKLTEHYGQRLEALYDEITRAQDDELSGLRAHLADRATVDTVTRAVAATLGVTIDAVAPEARFADLGGDSLSALSVSTLLTDLFEVDIEVGMLMSAGSDLQAIADHIDARRGGAAPRPVFASVHTSSATEVTAAELTLDRFIDEATLAAAPTLARASTSVSTVLLTGANGYLGRFLCLEWLERMAAVDGTVVCIVRGRDEADARARLTAAFDTDSTLLQRFHDLAAGHLDVLAGDIAEPDLGLSRERWQQLADTVDLVVHPAALVNHVLPYRQLFGPNVVGTAELIRLALTSTVKPITYLSTVAVAGGAGPQVLGEDLDIRTASATRAIDESYANGYGTSKWAGEVLLREANDLCGLPAAIFRSDMILAHSTFAGQLNAPDIFSRLLLSLIETGIAPETFYATDASGARPRAHYDGLPADFTAASIATIGASVTSGVHTFNVVNPHDDGISLDVIVDWLIEAGVTITRIGRHGEWVDRFERSLRALPEQQRQASVLPLLHAYSRPQPADAGSPFPAQRFAAAVAATGVGDDGRIPHLTADLITKYVRDLAALGLTTRTG